MTVLRIFRKPDRPLRAEADYIAWNLRIASRMAGNGVTMQSSWCARFP